MIIDSTMTFSEATYGTSTPTSVIDTLVLLDVEYISFDKRLHRGQLLLHRERVDEIKTAFEIMRRSDFPVAKCIPIVHYGWSDDASMAANNSSMFNYRLIAGQKVLSNHSFGMAIDINPFQNPAVYPDGRISPPGARYLPQTPGTLTQDNPVTRFFLENGWRWGAYLGHVADWQHFDRLN